MAKKKKSKQKQKQLNKEIDKELAKQKAAQQKEAKDKQKEAKQEEAKQKEAQAKNKKASKKETKQEDNSNENKQKEAKNSKEKAIIKVEGTKDLTSPEADENKNQISLPILIALAIIVVLIFLFSVIFALINTTKSVIISGITIKNIDVSNLSVSDAKSKLEKAFDIELNTPIQLTTDGYEIELNSNQIEFTYNVDDAAENAYSYGRNGNIFKNNYAILKSMIFGNEIKVDYSYNKDSLDSIVDSIESEIPGLVVEPSFYREGNDLIIVPGTDGITINKEELKAKIIDTILSANAEELKANNSKLKIAIPTENAQAKPIDIDSIYSEVYTKPKDAYYESEPFKIYAESEGVDFAISKEEAKALVSEKKEEYTIPLKITPAEKTINDIGLEAFPYLISEFTTKYDASNVNRSHNLEIAANKINGTVLMPGEEFSFNQVVGQRTIQEGYKDAKIYQDGQVVDGLAGGICQISSTLYNAVVKANLEIIERKNHSFPTSYIRAGQDATVVYGVKDFKFKNTRTYPIKISASVNSGIAEFKINGIKEEVEYEISLSPVTTGSIPYTTQYIQDPSLAPGQQVTVQRGSNGLRVTTYKDTKLDGKLVSREVMSNDTYSPMNTIIRVGP